MTLKRNIVNILNNMEQRSISYGELIELDNLFDKQCQENGVVWNDEETENNARMAFVCLYMDGNDEPNINDIL